MAQAEVGARGHAAGTAVLGRWRHDRSAAARDRPPDQSLGLRRRRRRLVRRPAAIGIGVAVSAAGVILCESFALTRLVHAVSHWRIRPITLAMGAGMVLVAPFTLIDPNGFYDTLLKPSLVALWLSQLIVFAVYPLFAIKHRQWAWPAWTLSLIASAFAIYGLVTTLQQASS
jgi:hypothetical protein